MSNYVMGIDIGTTGTKSMVVDLSGNILGKSYREYPLKYPAWNQVEIDADYLIEQVFDTVKEAIANAKVPAEEIRSISFSVQRATFMMLDENLNPINNTIYVWLDNRAEEDMAEIAALIDPHRQAHISGMPTSCIYTVEKFYWLKKHAPEIYNKTKYIALVDTYAMHKFGSDELVAEVTNQMVSGMIDVNTFEWSDEILDALGLDKRKLPRWWTPAPSSEKSRKTFPSAPALPSARSSSPAPATSRPPRWARASPKTAPCPSPWAPWASWWSAWRSRTLSSWKG